MNPIRKSLLALACAAAALSAQASVAVHSSWGAYNAATSGNATIDFESYGFAYFGHTLVAGDVTFTNNAPRFFVLPGGYYGDTFTSHYLNNNSQGTEIGIQFAAPVHGLAMDLGTIHNWGGGPLEFTFHVAGSSFVVPIDGQLCCGTNTPVSFIGFTSDMPITSITISDPTSGLALDNFTYTDALISQVPEPGTLALAGLALSGLALSRRRRSF